VILKWRYPVCTENDDQANQRNILQLVYLRTANKCISAFVGIFLVPRDKKTQILYIINGIIWGSLVKFLFFATVSDCLFPWSMSSWVHLGYQFPTMYLYPTKPRKAIFASLLIWTMVLNIILDLLGCLTPPPLWRGRDHPGKHGDRVIQTVWMLHSGADWDERWGSNISALLNLLPRLIEFYCSTTLQEFFFINHIWKKDVL
jgi:hypothetical protein